MEKKLIMTFNDEANNKVNVTVNSVKSGITPEQINKIMDLIVSSKVFSSKKGLLISKVSAETVDTTETAITLS